MEQGKELESLRVRVEDTTEPDKVTLIFPRRNSRTDFVGSNDSSKPLIEVDARDKPEPPIAGPEIDDFDDDDDDREVASAPYPGVDDGFFGNGDPPRDPDAEDIPTIGPRAGAPDEPDGPRKPELPPFPYGPGFDVESGGPGIAESIPDINIYQHKKTLAQGMMDLALLSANANQLRYVLESYDRHPYYYPSLVMVSLSLILQVAVGVGLIWNARYNVKDEKQMCIANRINNFTIIGIFLVTVINVFISAFGVANVSAITTTTP